MKNPKVAIVIPNFNGRELLANCLESIRSTSSYPNLEIIVVDNGSTDGSVEMIRRKFPEVLLITNPKNLGFPKACNQGARLALSRGADYILFLNNDTKILTKGWIEKLVEIANQDETIGILGPKITGRVEYPPTNRIWPSGLSEVFKQKTFPTSTVQVNFIAGVAFFVSRKLIDRIGLLDEIFSPFLCEDMDYFIRTRKAGFKIIFTPDVVIDHIHSATIGRISEEKQDYVFFIHKRNSFILARKHFSILWFLWEVMFGLFRAFFVKRDPNRPFYLFNIRPTKRFYKRVILLLKAMGFALSAPLQSSSSACSIDEQYS
jgi:GT2 family glycosyltransferase